MMTTESGERENFEWQNAEYELFSVILQARTIDKGKMTALELNAELFRDLSIVAEDEGLMRRAVGYLRRLAARKQTMDETEYIMSSPKMVEVIRQGQKDIEEGRGRVVELDDLWK